MIETIVNILMHTPLYVYILFFYLMLAGTMASRDRVISIFKPMILATVFLGMSLSMLVSSTLEFWMIIETWTAFLLVGILLGWFQVYRKNIKVDKKKKLIFLPGTWTTFAIILITFISKYYCGYVRYQDPQLFEKLSFQVFAIAISGCSSGLFMGRLINYFYRYNVYAHIDLSDQLIFQKKKTS